jgi:hypothetical protein
MSASLSDLRRVYRRALRDEVKLVDSLPDYPSPQLLDAAWRRAAATNAALLALKAHPDYHVGATLHVVA